MKTSIQFIFYLFMVLYFNLFTGCSQESSNSYLDDSDRNTDTDADSDTDSDADTGTDTGSIVDTGDTHTTDTNVPDTVDTDSGVSDTGTDIDTDTMDTENGIVIYADQPTQSQINAAGPGDVLLFEAGEHDRFDLRTIVSPECDPMVLTSLDPAHPAVIHNTTNPGWETILIENSEYVLVDNLVVQGGLTGILVKSSDHVIVRNSEIKNINQAGLKAKTNSSYVDFINNKVHNTGQSNPQYGEGMYMGTAASQDPDDKTIYLWMEGNEIFETGYGEAVDLKGGVRYSTFRNNHVHDIALGIDGGQTNEAAIVMGYQSDEAAYNWVEYNLVEDVSWGGGGEAGRPNVGASGIAVFGGGNYVHHNKVRNCLEYGIFLHAYGDPGFFVYEWDNDVSNSGYEDYHDGGLDNLMRYDPGYTNPNSPQSWCRNP